MKHAVKNAVAVLLGIVVAFAFLEIVLRVHNPFGSRLKGDEIVLPTNLPMRIENDGIPGLDDVIVHTKNSLGFRGEEPPENRAERFEIVTVGGSTTECLYLSDGHTWPDALAQRLRAVCPEVWLNNAGIDGHSTFGHLILVRDYLARLKPDMVLFLIGANDVGRTDLGEFDLARLRGFSTWRTAAATVISHSEVLSLLLNLYRRFKARHVAHKALHLDRLRRLDISRPDRRAVLTWHQRLVQRYATRVGALLDASERHGMAPVLVTQPALLGCGVDPTTGIDLSSLEYASGQDACLAWKVLEAYNDVVRKLARARKVPLIDLARRLPHDSALFYDWFHFTNRGAQMVGQIVFEELLPEVRRRTADCRAPENGAGRAHRTDWGRESPSRRDSAEQGSGRRVPSSDERGASMSRSRA